MQMNFDSPKIFLDCVGYQQYYKPATANCPTSGGTVPLFELAKVKKRESPSFLKFQWWQISLYEQQKMVSILHGIFTSAFSLVYCDKFSYEKPFLNPKSPEPQLCGFFWFLVMYMYAHVFGSMFHFFYFGRLAGMQ